MAIKISEYKGYEIQYESGNTPGFFAVKGEERMGRYGTEQGAKEAIDRQCKAIFTPVRGFDSTLVPGRITSVNIANRARAEYWFVTDTGGRDKNHTWGEDDTAIIKDTPENRERIKKIKALTGEMNTLRGHIELAKKALVRYTITELTGVPMDKED
jgi:hypothetical protein